MALINKLSAIGNAIREKTGKTDLLTLDQMPQEISGIETGGGDSFYDDFWDTYQEDGERINYDRAFYDKWDNNNFKPKYNMKPTQCSMMFQNSKISGDLREILKVSGVTLDTSDCTSYYSMYQSTLFTAVPTIYAEKAPSLNYLFYGSKQLETIEKIITSTAITYSGAFTTCSNLKNITFDGEIGNSISFQQSPLLSNDSVQNIIDHLANLTEQTPQTTQTLTVNPAVKVKLTDVQIASITSSGWTLA